MRIFQNSSMSRILSQKCFLTFFSRPPPIIYDRCSASAFHCCSWVPVVTQLQIRVRIVADKAHIAVLSVDRLGSIIMFCIMSHAQVCYILDRFALQLALGSRQLPPQWRCHIQENSPTVCFPKTVTPCLFVLGLRFQDSYYGATASFRAYMKAQLMWR